MLFFHLLNFILWIQNTIVAEENEVKWKINTHKKNKKKNEKKNTKEKAEKDSKRTGNFMWMNLYIDLIVIRGWHTFFPLRFCTFSKTCKKSNLLINPSTLHTCALRDNSLRCSFFFCDFFCALQPSYSSSTTDSHGNDRKIVTWRTQIWKSSKQTRTKENSGCSVRFCCVHVSMTIN